MHVRGATYGNGSTGSDVSLSNGGVARAGLFDDPFFFDLDAFSGAGGRSFCDGNEVDAFAGANVSAIVLEVPSSDFGSENIGVSARVLLKGTQVDRMGRPAINTVFITGDINKDLFNFTVPKKDPKIWGDDVVAALMSFGNDEATANSLASVLLPDLLTFDTTSSAGFLNGRRLPDDVIDAELALITGGALTGDCVDSNDTGFMTSFPYLGGPH
jgi:hypothetical protein